MRLALFGAVCVATATTACAEEIGRIAAGAYCRDQNGDIRQPPVRPDLPASAERASRGMVRTTSRVGGGECYLYLSEAALGPALPCSPASVGTGERRISGTLSARSCSNP